MRGKNDREDTIPSPQLIDILRFALVSINIGAIMAESATYRGRERNSKMVDELELGDVYGDDKRTDAPGRDKSRLGMLAVMMITFGPQLRQILQGEATPTSWRDSKLF